MAVVTEYSDVMKPETKAVPPAPVGDTGRMSNLRDVQLALPKECSKVGGGLHLGIHGSHMCHISGECGKHGRVGSDNRFMKDFSNDTLNSVQYTYLMHASRDFLDSSPFSWVKACCAFATISSKKGDPSLDGRTTVAPHTSTEGS